MANGNGTEKVWRDRILFFCVVAGFLAGGFMFIFATKAEVTAAVEPKADKSMVIGHLKEPAHREQVIVNEQQERLNAQQAEMNAAVAKGLKNIEIILTEQAVSDGPLRRRDIKAMLRDKP